MSFEDLRAGLKARRQTRNDLERRFRRGQERLRNLGTRIQRRKRLGREDGPELQGMGQQQKILEKQQSELQADLKQAQVDAADFLAHFVGLKTPQQSVEYLDDRTPFLLMPVRLETRFKESAGLPGGATRKELWLRIFPDNIHVETHEEVLTQDEVAAAQTYWTEVWRAGGDTDRELGAWRALMRKFGSPRAAWIVRAYKPNNEFDLSGDRNRPNNPLQEDAELDPAPAFDPYEPKQESWSQAPRATTLPDVFVAMGFNQGVKVMEYVGNLIPDPLIVGPDPAHPPDEKEGFKEDGGTWEVDAEMKWMVDFEEAIQVGMGMKIPLDPQTSAGFDRLVVLGLRLSADAEEGQELLESLIESHHYSVDGFSLVPQGTPTNNTGSGGAGFKTFVLGDDDSFRIELGSPLFTQEADWQKKHDGQYLADALGISPGVLEHIQFSDGFDQRDARAMNTALWPATLGYFLEEMMDPIFSRETIQQARGFFLNHVSGRGVVPAVRVGRQPYGILPTSAFSHWRYPGAEPPLTHQAIFPATFEARLFNLLMKMGRDWQAMAGQVAHVGLGEDRQQSLLDILGLHAASAEFHHRFATSLDQLTNLQKLQQLYLGATDIVALLRVLFSGFLQQFGVPPEDRPAICEKIFFKLHTPLNGPPVEKGVLSDAALQPISEDDENYLAWLATSPVDTIRRQDFGKKAGESIAPPTALLYLMLRQAVMNAYWDAAWNFCLTAQLVPMPPRQEPALLFIKEQDQSASKFSLLYREAGDLTQNHPAVFQNPNLTIAEQISHPDIIRIRPETQSLREVQEALGCLQDRSTKALARVLSEHLDLCSYRLDAWKLGIVNQRLQEQRDVGGQVNQGIYLGACGWLEDVRPQESLQPYKGKAPGDFLDNAEPPLQVAPENGGYLHGPSLNHAITGAILRNAYISHAGQDNASVTAVNLTSERVRNALAIIEGVQNGQELGALLGYQFERGLHDRYGQAEVDAFIFPLRKKFPLVGEHLVKAPEDDPVPIEAIEARNVIDGLALIRHVQETQQPQYPFGLDNLPWGDPEQRQAIEQEVDRLENLLDSVSDLLMAESVYQVVQGNYDRAGAILNILAKPGNLPSPEILQTPRSGYAMTHRLLIKFKAQIPPGEINPYEGVLPLTARAQAEPGINQWLASFIPDPVRLVSAATYLEDDGTEHHYEVSLRDLQLQPLDLLYLLEEELQQNRSELDSMIVFALKQQQGLSREATVRIEYTKPVPGKITFFEFMPLLRSLKSLILDSRALHGQDLILPTPQARELDPKPPPDPNPKGWEAADIQARVQTAHDRLKQLKTDLNDGITALSQALPASQDFQQMRDHLLNASKFGLQQCIPEPAVEETEAAAQELSSQAQKAIVLIEERLAGYDELFPLDAAQSIDQQVATWMDAGKKLFGPSFSWAPAFNLKLPLEMENAYQNCAHTLRYLQGLSPFPLDEWLYGLARVRPKAQSLETCIFMAENFGAPSPELTPLQLPHKADDFWVGSDYPEDYSFDGDRLLLTSVLTGPWAPGEPWAGLLLDEWTEVVPRKHETTGVTFHYDAPNSEPPQALLLVVTPEITGSWKWDHLVAALNETLELAKSRAVEPRHLDDSQYAQFLPGIMVPVTPILITIATNLLVNVGMMGTQQP